MLLVSGTGRILGANCAFCQRAQLPLAELIERPLADLVTGPRQQLDDYLHQVSRSSEQLPGMLPLSGVSEAESWHCVGAVLAPHVDPAQQQILLRFLPPASAEQQFVVLQEQLQELSDEVARRRRAETDLSRQQRHLETTLHSIGDAVIVTDPHGRVTALNPVARQLTGWGDEALGEPLVKIFNILNELTGEPVENPAEKALREGVVIGLANHTILISKAGTAYAINDSAAPIRDENDVIVGVILVFRDVSAQRRSERILRNSEERLRLALEAGRMGTWEWDIETERVHWSPSLERIHGLRPGTFGGTFEDYQSDIHPDDREQVLGSLRRALETGQEHHLEYRIIWPDKSLHWIEARGKVYRSSQGNPERMLGICMDITQRKHVEQDLKLQARVLESMTEGVIITDHHGVILFTNPAEDAMFGYEPGELIGQSVTLLNDYPAEQSERFVAELVARLETEGAYTLEVRNRKKDGTPFVTRARITGLELNGQNYWVCVQEDITEQQRAEAQLRESELRFRQLAEHIQDVFYIRDPHQAAVLYISPAYEEIWGQPCDELYHNPDAHLSAIHPDDLPRVLDAMARQREGTATAEEYRISQPGRFTRWIRDRAFPVLDAAGRVERICGIAQDITSRKQYESMLHFLAEASETLASLVDLETTLQKLAQFAVPTFADWCAVYLVEPDQTLRCVATAHVDPEKVAWASRFHQEYPPAPHLSRVLQTGAADIVQEVSDEHLVQVAQDEEYLRILRELGLKSYMSVPLMGREGTVGVLTFLAAESGRRFSYEDLSVAEDIAHRASIALENARLYHEVREADRRKDDFLAMLAHELRNPLAPIRSGLDLLALENPGQREIVDIMQHQVEHLVRLVDDLLDVSRIMRSKVDLRLEPVELGPLVRRAAEVIRTTIESQEQKLTISLPDEPVWLTADPVRLVQIIENLLNNASKYTDRGGQIELGVEREASSILITVRDNGVGMEAELLPRIFDLFVQASQSLDRSRGGLGIGLTLVRSLVEMHGGSITAESAGPGHGSCFAVDLPVGQPVPQTTSNNSSPAHTGSHRILLVDDNVGASQMLSLLLTRLGTHTVEVVHNGHHALEKAGTFRPDIIMLDIGLPGMDGYQVAQQLRGNPHFDSMLLVALTGYGQEEDRRRSREAGFDVHLVKPPALEEIESVLQHPKLATRPAAPPPTITPPSTSLSAALGRSEAEPPAAEESPSAPLQMAAFTRELGHELGNAIVPLRLLLQMVKRTKNDPTTIDAVEEFLDEHLPSMTKLVEDLRRVGRVARGIPTPQLADAQLAAVLDRALDRVRPLIEARTHQLKVDLTEAPESIYADAELLEQLVVNLLENAALYTPPGGRITLTATSAAHGYAICVQDTGPGIDPQLAAQLFDPLVRGEGHFDFQEGHLGVGLTLAKQIARAHEGTIHVHSSSAGSEFTVRLPHLK